MLHGLHIKMTEKWYTLTLVENGDEEQIFASTGAQHVRRIATGKKFTKRISRGIGRRACIYINNKLQPNGAYALDALCYQLWLEQNQPEDNAQEKQQI